MDIEAEFPSKIHWLFVRSLLQQREDNDEI